MIYIGCGGWAWLGDLSKYALLFRSVEINTSFYRAPQLKTFERWADTVPDDFMFSVKLFQGFTHTHRLADAAGLDDFINAMNGLGNKLGPLLVQLPPSLAFDDRIVGKFFSLLRERFNGDVVCEPRHLSWFTPAMNQFLANYRIAQVAADPWRVREQSEPGGWKGIVYYRLHGSPHVYKSAYTAEFLQALAPKLLAAARSVQVWCIFDNTAGSVAANASDLIKLVK